MTTDELFEYKGYQIPVRLMYLTGGGPDSFDAISRSHIDLLEQHIGLFPDMRIVEIGCGIGRDAIPLTERLARHGSYLGIDVNREQIDWCIHHITSRYPNFRFQYFDIKEDWYNPDGALALTECRIPEASGSVDLIILQSVFTHMLPSDLRHYLFEFGRVLKSKGRVFTTFFLMTNEIFSTQTEDSALFFYEFGDGVYIIDPDHPTKTVAYEDEKLRSMLTEAGLEPAVPPIRGSWVGPHLRSQDIVIMAPQPARLAWWRRISRVFSELR